jgi:hypothetical protein
VWVFDETAVWWMVCLLAPGTGRPTWLGGRVVGTRVGQKGSIDTSTRDVRSLTLLFVICLLTDRFKRDSRGIGSSDKLDRLGECLNPCVITRSKALDKPKNQLCLREGSRWVKVSETMVDLLELT